MVRSAQIGNFGPLHGSEVGVAARDSGAQHAIAHALCACPAGRQKAELPAHDETLKFNEEASGFNGDR